jgi:hypothetical protein
MKKKNNIEMIDLYVIYLETIKEVWGNMVFKSKEDAHTFASNHIPQDVRFEVQNMNTVFRKFRNYAINKHIQL